MRRFPTHFQMDETHKREYSPPHPLPRKLLQENVYGATKIPGQLFSLPFLGLSSPAAEAKKPLKILMKSAWGSDDPTRATFPFAHGLALADAGHDVQIFLLGEATYLMRKATASAVVPVGWPPLSETLEKVVARHIPIFA
jgi:hypothetical protein